MTRVLLVEDDLSLGQTIAERLTRRQHDVEWVRTVADAEVSLTRTGWDLAILDVKLPDGSGFGLARRIKRQSVTPVMFMTALNSAAHRLEGYEIGAEEFLPKPFHLKEFMLRVSRLLAAARPRRLVVDGGRVIDFDALSVVTDGRRTTLQVRDGRVLALLVDAAPRAVDRSEIIERVWAEAGAPTPRAIDNAVVRLRRALGDTEGRIIQSVRGVGYRWAPDQPGRA